MTCLAGRLQGYDPALLGGHDDPLASFAVVDSGPQSGVQECAQYVVKGANASPARLVVAMQRARTRAQQRSR